MLLAQKIKTGDMGARDRLVLTNLRFVIPIAKQYQGSGLPLNELINTGNIGLIKAAERFDETKGFKFISYAVTWITQSILNELAEFGRLIRLPQNKIQEINKVKKAIDAFIQEYEYMPAAEELAEFLDMDSAHIENLLQLNDRPQSIDAPIQGSEDYTLGDTLQGGDSPDTKLRKKFLQLQVKKLLATISPRNAEIISAIYEIGDDIVPWINKVKKKFNLTEDQVRGANTRSSKKLRRIASKMVFDT